MTKRLKPLTPDEMRNHVLELCRAFKVLCIEEDRMKPEHASAHGFHTARMIHVKPVTDECTYIIALHELGHCVQPAGMGVQVKLTGEYAAWEWAEYYALDWTPAMEHVKQYALGTYEKDHAIQERAKATAQQRDAARPAAFKKFIKKVLK